MRYLLQLDDDMSQKYFSVEDKKERESAEHVLSILKEKGLVN